MVLLLIRPPPRLVHNLFQFNYQMPESWWGKLLMGPGKLAIRSERAFVCDDDFLCVY